MSRFLLILLAACGVEPPDAPHTVTPDWRLDGSAEIEHGRLSMFTCCAADGSAVRPLPELAGTGSWTITISHANTECTTAAMAFAVWHEDGKVRAAQFARLDAGKKGGVATLDVDLDEPEAMELWIGTRGGKSCCGTTTIDRVEIAVAGTVKPR
jgi:hypothetical protein